MQTETNETTAQSFKPFDAFTIEGDTRTVEFGPVTIRATIVADTDTRPDDFDCYTPEAIAAWRRNEWQFVGVVLSIWVGDMCLDDYTASLWGIDCNYPGGDNAYLTECADDLLGEAKEVATKALARLRARLAD